MSLYVGHLSPHVRPDELERVFRRFGRCSFQLKDGYGFVVYEVIANAERALRALRGKQVCGEQISLNWSNKQPRPFQRPTRGSRFDEPYRGGVFREEDNVTGFRSSQDRRDFSRDVPISTYNHGGRLIDGAPDKEAGNTHEDDDNVRGNRGENLKDALLDEDNGELNPLEHDRWGEPTSDMLPAHGSGKGYELDRYEPYHGCNKRDEKGNQRASSDSSPYRGLHEKGRKEHFIVEAENFFDKSIPHPICYNCGQVGHIKRKCPEGDGRRDRFSKFEHMRDEISFRDKIEGRLKKFRANSWGRPSTSRDPFVARRRAWDRKELHSNKDGKSLRTGSSTERREKRRSKQHSESQTKKETKKKYSSKKKSEKKRRGRVSDTSSISSYSSKSTSGRSPSKSISGTRSHSTSRSASSKSRPASSRSKSISVSSYAKSKSSRSRSRSMSRSRSRSTRHRSLSLSISLGQKSSSSLKNTERNISVTTTLKENSEHMESPESKHFSKMNDFEVKTLEGENALSPLGVKNQPDVEYSGKNSDSAHKSDLKAGYDETDASFDVINGTASASENCPETSTLQGTLSMKPVEQVTDDSTRISTEDMLSALRHYGLVSPNEDELDVSVEGYFGAARLWPWEMIYYRRLKRGPISTENYAKRIKQNKEFGIVDKYIRSSSGWGERQRDT